MALLSPICYLLVSVLFEFLNPVKGLFMHTLYLVYLVELLRNIWAEMYDQPFQIVDLYVLQYSRWK